MRDGEPAIAVVRRLAELSQNQAKKLFSGGKVYVESLPCLSWFQPLAEGTEVSIDTDRKNPRKLVRLKQNPIVHFDRYYAVINKPAGLVSVPPTRTGEPTLLDQLPEFLKDRPGPPRPIPLHRLDRETCGLMVFGLEAGDPTASHAPLQALRRQFGDHSVGRSYYAVVQGHLDSCRLSGEIDVTRGRFGGKQQRKKAITEVEHVSCAGPGTLVICRPLTGRWHQLRIQLSQAGHPIVGEREHLPPDCRPAVSSARLALQSFRLRLKHPESGKERTFEIPLDPDIEAILDQARSMGG